MKPFVMTISFANKQKTLIDVVFVYDGRVINYKNQTVQRARDLLENAIENYSDSYIMSGLESCDREVVRKVFYND